MAAPPLQHPYRHPLRPTTVVFRQPHLLHHLPAIIPQLGQKRKAREKARKRREIQHLILILRMATLVRNHRLLGVLVSNRISTILPREMGQDGVIVLMFWKGFRQLNLAWALLIISNLISHSKIILIFSFCLKPYFPLKLRMRTNAHNAHHILVSLA